MGLLIKSSTISIIRFMSKMPASKAKKEIRSTEIRF